jgi:hypothetical protein
MTRTRITLTTAALLAAALAAQGLVLALWNTGIGVAGFGYSLASQFGAYVFWSLLVALLHYAAFGLGVFVSLRFLAPVGSGESWRQTIGRAIVASVAGAIIAFAFSALVSLIAAVTIGAYPFGYSLDAGVDGSRVQWGFTNALSGSLTPLIGWLPLTVLCVVFLKLWLAAHPGAVEVKDHASVAE